jgi:putative DNA primase/helicase
MTGQDPIRYERKGIQQCRDFVFEGMVILSANEAPESSDRTSGQERRKLTVGLDSRVAEYEGRNLVKEFEPYLPGLLARVLEITPERVTQLVKYSDCNVPSLARKKWEQMTETNPIATWLDESCVLLPEAKTYIGNNNPDRMTTWLYAHFCAHQKGSGHKTVLSVKRFSSNLKDLLNNQLKLASVESGKDRGGAFIQGLGLRCHHDPSGLRYPTPITKKSLCDGFVMDGDGFVTAETIGSDGCDGCDGFFEGQEITEKEISSVWEQPELPFPEVESVTEVKQKPSHPSHPSPASIPAVTNPSHNPSQQTEPKRFAEQVRLALIARNVTAAKELVRILNADPVLFEQAKGELTAEERHNLKTLSVPGR